MKKIIITLLAVLLLLSFTSCDIQKKIDEALSEQKDSLISFRDTYAATKRYVNVGNSLTNENSKEYILSNFNSNETDKANAAKTAIYTLLGYSNINYNVFLDSNSSESTTKNIESATGTLRVEKSEDGAYTLTAVGVDIKATYTSSDSETTITASLTLDGVIYYKSTTGEEETIERKVTDFKQNGVQYKDIEFTLTYSEGVSKYTKAFCDGKKVDLDILNKYMDTPAMV